MTTVDKSKFATAADLLSRLTEIVEKNPEALVMMATDNGSGYLVLDELFTDLDSDGDARFGVRDYETGKKVEVIETEDLYYQND